MQLHFRAHLASGKPWAKGEVRPARFAYHLPRNSFRAFLAFVVCFLTFVASSYSQQKRMVIDGSIRQENTPLPPTTKIRILHADGSIARTVQFYDPRGYKFGVRLSSYDEFSENEKIIFRVVTAPRDSFVARYVGNALRFHGTPATMTAPVTRVELFRNNLPTVYRSLRDTSVSERQELRYRMVAVDKDADTVRYGFRNGPPGAEIDGVTGLFSWRPTFDQAGEYRIIFLISDGYEVDSSHVSKIRVKNVNRSPRIVESVPDTSIGEGDTLRFRIRAVDPDGDKLMYHSLLMPEGGTMDSTEGIMQWVPTFEQAGAYSVRFAVTDGALSDTTGTSRITVINVDRPPAFFASMNDTTIFENQALEFRYAARDPDDDSVVYMIERGPAGVSLDSVGVLRWRPTFTQSGDYTLVVSANDKKLTKEAKSTVRVLDVDRPPGSFVLNRPARNDTVRMVLSTPLRFSWTRSVDPDIGDTVQYRIHFWGPKLDTTFRNQYDTAIQVNLKTHLQYLSHYFWTVIGSDGVLATVAADTFAFATSGGITGSVELLSQTPKSYDLEQSIPDPFNPMTTIRYALPERSYVKLTIFNMLGEALIVLVSGEKDAGIYDVTFDASEFTSGAYMFRLDAHPLSGNPSKDFVNTKKMFIVR
jgi:hypothetical protein